MTNKNKEQFKDLFGGIILSLGIGLLFDGSKSWGALIVGIGWATLICVNVLED